LNICSSTTATIPDIILDRMAEKFRMLSDTTRLSIVQALLAGEKSVGQVATETGQGQANVSKQLKMLADSGMVRRRKEGLQVFYAVSDPLVERLCELVCGTILQEAEGEGEGERHRLLLRSWRERG
jgi:DNA-binding transcriptional ArsR family regulator